MTSNKNKSQFYYGHIELSFVELIFFFKTSTGKINDIR